MAYRYNNPHSDIGDSLDEIMRLSSAIERGDTNDARICLDAMARELGTDAVEAVSRGRYSRKARTA